MDAVLIGFGLLAVLGLVVMADPGAALQWVYSRSISDAEARRSVAAWAGGESGVPRSLRVVHARVDAGRDSTWWYKLSVDPADVPALKRSVQERGGMHVRPDAGEANGISLPTKDRWPRWWKPDGLGDADWVQVGMTTFVFAQKTGVGYVVNDSF